MATQIKTKSHSMDMTHGPLLGKIIRFAIPVMLSGCLQLLFNAADMVVVGKFAGPTSLAAVGSTGALINLVVGLFMGLSIGANVLVARYYGAGQHKDLSETVHTAILASVMFGFVLIFLGIVVARPMLTLMGTPADVIDKSVLYMRIYFIGMPFMMLYNYGASILRAIGDTKRPLYYLIIAGFVNVILNLILVIVFHMGVAGVAIATGMSQAVSAVLVVICLIKDGDKPYGLRLSELKLNRHKLLEMLKIGLPAGIQGCVFSLSNMVVQSSVNSFGSTVMAGNTAAANIEGFVYMAMNSFYQTAISFTSQNFGARKYKRINRVAIYCQVCVIITGVVLGAAGYIFAKPLLGIYTSDPEVIGYGVTRMFYCCLPYFVCGMMDTFVGIMRGLGYSVLPMFVSIGGACGLRILWITTVFSHFRTLQMLYIVYIITWTVTMLCHFISFMIVRRRYPKEDMPDVKYN
ncbi:MAG: MATE family efflux transporter [Clostridia bacterium]|nr:MATE family efflux transporter [Clostridia bacterium]